MKICLGARTGPKNPRRRIQNAPNTKVCSASMSTIQNFKSAKLAPFGLWPNALWVMIRHTLFDLFAEG